MKLIKSILYECVCVCSCFHLPARNASTGTDGYGIAYGYPSRLRAFGFRLGRYL